MLFVMNVLRWTWMKKKAFSQLRLAFIESFYEMFIDWSNNAHKLPTIKRNLLLTLMERNFVWKFFFIISESSFSVITKSFRKNFLKKKKKHKKCESENVWRASEYKMNKIILSPISHSEKKRDFKKTNFFLISCS